MHSIIAKTFGGLSRSYYMRHFFFALALTVLFTFMMSQGSTPINYGVVAFLAISTLLYPYSRFVYESVVGYLLGEIDSFMTIFLLQGVRALTMALCWILAVFIAPIGLIYLYFHNSPNQTR